VTQINSKEEAGRALELLCHAERGMTVGECAEAFDLGMSPEQYKRERRGEPCRLCGAVEPHQHCPTCKEWAHGDEPCA
jgi:hypothetical protein